MIYGYCRVSTAKQNADRQIINISKVYGSSVAKCFIDKYTGTTLARPEWQKLMKTIRSGDTIVFDEVSRMSRDGEEGTKMYFELFDKGIDLVFLKEPQINTQTYKTAISDSIAKTGNEIADMYIDTTNKVLRLLADKQIRMAFDQAQKERDYLSKRTSEGVRRAQNEGKRCGMPEGKKIETAKAKSKKEVIRDLSRTFGGMLTDEDCIKVCEISRNTYYKYKKELIEELKKEGVIVA